MNGGNMVPSPAALASQALVSPGSAASLACVGRLLQSGEEHVLIEAIGDSVTRGPAKRSMSYPAVLQRLLRQQFPKAKLTIHNSGFNGATLDLLSACLQRMASTAAKVVLIETTDNLGFTTARRAAELLQHMMRTLAARAMPRPQVILVSPFAQSCTRRVLRRQRGRQQMLAMLNASASARNTKIIAKANKSKLVLHESLESSIEACFAADALPTAIEELAAQLGVPCVSMRAGLSNWLRSDPKSTLARYVGHDSVHPTLEGFELLARGCLNAFTQALEGQVSDGGCFNDRAQSIGSLAPPPPPLPVLPTCAFGPEMRPFVLHQRDWEYTTEYSRQGHPKPGYIARAPGAVLDVCHRGKHVWQFAYLKSWEGMGRVRGSCEESSGCTCMPRTWDGHTDKRVSQTTISKLVITHKKLSSEGTRSHNATCPCIVRLTVLADTSSQGHKFKVDAFFGSFHIYSGAELLTGTGDSAQLTAQIQQSSQQDTPGSPPTRTIGSNN